MTGARRKDGFTLIELLVVIVIIGVLAVIGMPQYWKTVERTKSNEAIQLFDTIASAQHRYYSKYNTYCMATAGCGGFDFMMPVLHYFGAFSLGPSSSPPGWKASLIRTTALPMYGNYTISAEVNANGALVFSCNQINCMNDLVPTPLH